MNPRRSTQRALAAASAAGGMALLVAAGALSVVAPAAADPSAGATSTVTASATATPTAGSSASSSASPSPSLSVSSSASPSASPSPTGSATSSPSASPTTTASPSATSSPTSSQPPAAGVVPVDDAVLRWGLNNESNNRAFAPGTFNFLAAGLIPDPGQGGQQIAKGDWRARAGQVRVEKWTGTTWGPATWKGLRTDADGQALTSPTEGRFSDNRLVFSGGHGTVDAADGDATLRWDGDATVVYYSGMSFFYLSDPVLQVEDGVGRLTAVLGGFASSQSDTSVWQQVPSRRVVVADLPKVDLGGEDGFLAQPAYLGVDAAGVQEVPGTYQGSFPSPFVAFMKKLGTAAFWYASGASTDAFKVPLPLSVGYDASGGPQTTPTAAPQPTATVTVTSAPVSTPTVVTTVTTVPVPISTAVAGFPVLTAPPLTAGVVPGAAVGGLPGLEAVGPTELLDRPATRMSLASADAPPSPAWPWGLGAGLLVLAALLVLAQSPLLLRPRKDTP